MTTGHGELPDLFGIDLCDGKLCYKQGFNKTSFIATGWLQMLRSIPSKLFRKTNNSVMPAAELAKLVDCLSGTT
ncbi:hypothetical protein OPR82_11610 [Brucella sp. YY2X]|uniref:Transposase n=1 Tax=Ochrobactrum chromiisoli TaxID=2993941 RepID=A0ABT3QP65_9HYPH|nr:hypothetical protein [Ochrobactrum chromiisoli]MCX2697408.1 hypothetical protein [Ochrobactrum chromiisoli]